MFADIYDIFSQLEFMEIFSAGLLFFSLISFASTFLFLLTARRTDGVVVEMIYRSGSKGRGGYSPMFKFTTEEGEEFTASEKLSSNPPRFQVGQQVRVLYNAWNPRRARLNNPLNLFFTPLMLGGFGLIFGLKPFMLVLNQLLLLFK